MIKERIFEIDFFKTLAIILMVIFHFVYDLNEFIGIDINYESGSWYILGRIAAFLFIILAGINSGFSRNNVKRGMKVFGLGMVLTVITIFVFGEQYIRFGILHFLGISMILFPLLKRMHNWVLLIIAVMIALLFCFDNPLLHTSFISLFENTFGKPSVDYYPLFPYLSLFILGILLYKIYYHKKKSIFKLYTQNKVVIWISKYSLLIYLIHQPIILGAIFLFSIL